MVRTLSWIGLAFALLALARMGTVAPAQSQDKAPDAKKEDPVPSTPAPTKSEPSGVQEPAAKSSGGDDHAAALGNGMLTAPGAPADVDTVPSMFSPRTAADDQLATVGYRLRHLSAEQRASVYAEIGKPSSASHAQVPAAVGAQIPADLARGGLTPLPQAVTARFPELNGLTFAVLNGKLALIEPTMRIVVDVAAQ